MSVRIDASLAALGIPSWPSCPYKPKIIVKFTVILRKSFYKEGHYR